MSRDRVTVEVKGSEISSFKQTATLVMFVVGFI